MKRKILSLALLCALSLTACAAPAAEEQLPLSTQSAPTASAPAESAPEQTDPEDEEEFPDPGGQQMAIDAYSAICTFFGGEDFVQGKEYGWWFPEEFADAYIGDDNFLYVCLTDTSEEVLARYRGAVPEPRILRFVKVEHSYADLTALQTALVKIEGLDFSFVGIDVSDNEVDMGIPDLTKEDEVWDLIESQVPENVKERFEELPITIEESPYITFE